MDVRTRSHRQLIATAALLFCGLFIASGIILPQPPKGSLQLSSAAFKDREPIPVQYTCDGKNISPPLTWTDVPPTTRRFVLIADDPDAPAALSVHSITSNLPSTITGLA